MTAPFFFCLVIGLYNLLAAFVMTFFPDSALAGMMMFISAPCIIV
jgi:hypothetical protein